MVFQLNKEGVPMKKVLPIFCVFILLTISACFPQAAQAPQVDYSPTLTSFAVEVSNLKRDLQDLQVEKERLMAEKSDLSGQIADLQAQVAQNAAAAARVTELEGKLTDLQRQLGDAQDALAGYEDIIAAYEEIFNGEYYDEDGLLIFCEDAFNVSFGYVDRVSMRKQLVQYVFDQYIADGYEVDINTISSEHQQIWTDENDALIKIHLLDYLEPFVVTFDNPEYDIHSAVYSVRFQCFADYPLLEERYLALHGN